MSDKKPITQKQIILAAKGDQNAIAELYEQTYPFVYRTVRTMVQDEDTALDLVSDSYIKAFQSLEQLDTPEHFGAWMKRIAVNKTKDYFKKKKPVLFSEMENEDGEEPEFLDENRNNMPEEVLDRQETTRLIGEILDTLSEEQRMAITMFYYDEMSVKEIAAILECSENTVKSRLNYGRKKIETKVLDLEKQGTKLYSLAPVPFLLWLLRMDADTAAPSLRAFRKILGGCAAASPAAAAIAHAGAPAQASAQPTYEPYHGPEQDSEPQTSVNREPAPEQAPAEPSGAQAGRSTGGSARAAGRKAGAHAAKAGAKAAAKAAAGAGTKALAVKITAGVLALALLGGGAAIGISKIQKSREDPVQKPEESHHSFFDREENREKAEDTLVLTPTGMVPAEDYTGNGAAPQQIPEETAAATETAPVESPQAPEAQETVPGKTEAPGRTPEISMESGKMTAASYQEILDIYRAARDAEDYLENPTAYLPLNPINMSDYHTYHDPSRDFYWTEHNPLGDERGFLLIGYGSQDGVNIMDAYVMVGDRATEMVAIPTLGRSSHMTVYTDNHVHIMDVMTDTSSLSLLLHEELFEEYRYQNGVDDTSELLNIQSFLESDPQVQDFTWHSLDEEISAAEQNQVTSQKDTAEDVLDYYRGIMAMDHMEFYKGQYNQVPFSMDVLEYHAYALPPEELDGVFYDNTSDHTSQMLYALFDLDGDGIQELYIASQFDDFEPTLLRMFYPDPDQGGKMVPAWKETGDILWDGTILEYQGNGGEITAIYRLVNSSLRNGGEETGFTLGFPEDYGKFEDALNAAGGRVTGLDWQPIA